MLRLLLAWRLARMLRPLLLCGLLALALSAVFHGRSASPRPPQPSLGHVSHGTQRRLWPLLLSARHALSAELERALH